MEGVGLLVPVLAATAVVAVLGLLAALSRKRSTEDASRAYLAGVRYVLSDEPDAAIAELSRAAQLNTGTTETYFALAALMRRKGELAWAIRLGQNMLLKPQLQPEVRRRARLELALDYRRAGMQDRARRPSRRWSPTRRSSPRRWSPSAAS
jgi:lipopolysaccharide biosynthesis regulator YciM